MERRQQAGHEPVDVEEGHDVQAPIGRLESQRHAHVSGRRKKLAVGERDDLRPRRRSRRVKDERLGVRGRIELSGRAAESVKHEAACFRRRVDPKFEDLNPERSRNVTNRRPDIHPDDDGASLEVPKEELQLRGSIRGIERCTDGRGADRQECRGGFGTVFHDESHPIALGDAVPTKRSSNVRGLLGEIGVRPVGSTGCKQCDVVRLRARAFHE